MVLDIACEAQRVTCRVVDGAADLLSIFTNDGETGLDVAQALVSQRVGALEIGSNIAEGSSEVWQDGLGKTVIAVVGELKGLGAVRVFLEERDGV